MYRFAVLIVSAIAASGCQQWREPPLVSVAEQGLVPPVQPGDVFLPLATIGPRLEQGMVVPGQIMPTAPHSGMPNIQFGAVPQYAKPGQVALQNPLFVPVTNRDAAWRGIVDVVDDYFKIASEEQVHEVGGLLTEGRIETWPRGGATHVEPHRRDSVGLLNRWHGTLQTIRRTAVASIVPTDGGYLIDLNIQKELEDLPRPEHATAGAATFRSDGSLPNRRTEEVSPTYASPNWIPLGRDPALEQRILSAIRAKLDVAPPGVVY